MKQFTIRNGNFTETGNFSAYTAEGSRIHVPGRIMTSLGLTAEKPVAFPFYVLAEESEITPFIPGTKTPQTNPDGTLVVAIRTTAKSAYLTEDSMFDASNDSKLLAVKAQRHFVKTTQALGLTTEDIRAFANASI